MARAVLMLVCLCGIAAPPLSAQSDLDALMERVLARRDQGWKTLQQYVLEERETLQVTGPGNRPLYGFRREYLWFPREGRFIRSPLTADGVTLSEAERRRAEDLWVRREENRDGKTRGEVSLGPGGIDVQFEKTAMREALEPGFISAAYFLTFTFEPGQYALAGRDRHEGREVLQIEYYPTRMFKEGRTRPNRKIRERNPDVVRQMNKTSLVTLWVDPAQAQIVRYDFRNMDTSFLPGRLWAHIDALQAAMEMSQPFPDVWLPRRIDVGFDLALAIGEVEGRYSAEFHDYRLATVDTRLRP